MVFTQATRREFIEFLGRSAVAASWLGNASLGLGAALSDTKKLVGLTPQTTDSVVLAPGFDSYVVAKWGDAINKKGDLFGFNCDYTAYFPLKKDGSEGLLCVNHEYPGPQIILSGYQSGEKRNQAQLDIEKKALGVSVIKVRKTKKGKFELVFNDPMNRRLDANTPIPFSNGTLIENSPSAVGTFSNCAGGTTPWGTFLTCEENYQDYYGEVSMEGKWSAPSDGWGWHELERRPPQHYGWVVEIDPKSGKGKKHISLGRFSHEGATVVLAKDGRTVVYMGDDAESQCLYKFVSAKKGSLDFGTLYVADTKRGEWLILDREKNASLKSQFKSQLDVMIHTRLASEIVGGTPLHRPEDIAVDPITGAVLISLTNSLKNLDPFGQIAKLVEEKNDPAATRFSFSTFAHGSANGFASPDNLEFDSKGNLWMTTDMTGKLIGKAPYTNLGNNGLFFFETHGKETFPPIQIASAPVDAEFTGPTLVESARTLFLSVQHPGEQTKDKANPTSRWPDGGKSFPKSAVIAVTGPKI